MGGEGPARPLGRPAGTNERSGRSDRDLANSAGNSQNDVSSEYSGGALSRKTSLAAFSGVGSVPLLSRTAAGDQPSDSQDALQLSSDTQNGTGSAPWVNVREMSVGQNTSGHRWSVDKLLSRSKSSFWPPVLGAMDLDSVVRFSAAGSGRSGGAGDVSVPGPPLARTDGALKGLIADGFCSMWTHPLGRLYLLVYLLWIQRHNHLFFWLDIVRFRQSYTGLYAFARKQMAQRVYSAYLSQSSPNAVHVLYRRESPQRFLLYVLSHLDSPNRAIFDDYAYMLVASLEELFGGADAAAGQSTLTSSTAGAGSTGAAAPPFLESPVFQLMRKDLSGCAVFSTRHVQRAIERIGEAGRAFKRDGRELQDRLTHFFASLGLALDTEQLGKRRSYAHVDLGGSTSGASGAAGGNSGAVDLGASSAASLGASVASMVLGTSTGASAAAAAAAAASPGASRPVLQDHTLLLCPSPGQPCCDYCLEALGSARGGSDDPLAPFRCDACGLVCHRQCRSLTSATCATDLGSDRSGADERAPADGLAGLRIDEDEDDQGAAERLEKVANRMHSIQQQIEIELKIRQGLDRVARARKTLVSASGASGGSNAGRATASSSDLGDYAASHGSTAGGLEEAGMEAQMVKSNNKLDLLKRELQKCQLQKGLLETLLHKNADAEPAADAAAARAGGGAQMLTVRCADARSGSELSSTFLVTRTQTVESVITAVLEKFHLNSPSADTAAQTLPETSAWEVAVPLVSGDPLVLEGDAHAPPLLEQLTALMRGGKTPGASPIVLVRRRKQPAPATPGTETSFAKLAATAVDAANHSKKVLAVVMELVETELNYVDDLTATVQSFLVPMLEHAEFRSEVPLVFSNLEEVLAVHSAIAPALQQLRASLSAPGGGMGSAVARGQTELLELLDHIADQLAPYQTYCANQEFARLRLQTLRADHAFAKLLTQCESSGRLRKLRIDDFLVKPMHRITRYPILLKRLQSYYADDTDAYQRLTNLISAIERSVLLVNSAVRNSASLLRIQAIDDLLDFGGSADRFRIANGRRTLVSEKPFMLVRRVGPPAPVLLLLFGDLLLAAVEKKDRLVLVRAPMPLEHMGFFADARRRTAVEILVAGHPPLVVQAMSASDRASWLAEAENVRAHHVRALYNAEMALSQDYVEHHALAVQQSMAVPNLASLNASSSGSIHRTFRASGRQRPSTMLAASSGALLSKSNSVAQNHRRVETVPTRAPEVLPVDANGAAAAGDRSGAVIRRACSLDDCGNASNGGSSAALSSKAGSVQRVNDPLALDIESIMHASTSRDGSHPTLSALSVNAVDPSATLPGDDAGGAANLGQQMAPAVSKTSLSRRPLSAAAAPFLRFFDLAGTDDAANAQRRGSSSTLLAASPTSPRATALPASDCTGTPRRPSAFDIDDLLADDARPGQSEMSQEPRGTTGTPKRRPSAPSALLSRRASVQSTASADDIAGSEAPAPRPILPPASRNRLSLTRLSVLLRASASPASEAIGPTAANSAQTPSPAMVSNTSVSTSQINVAEVDEEPVETTADGVRRSNSLVPGHSAGSLAIRRRSRFEALGLHRHFGASSGSNAASAMSLDGPSADQAPQPLHETVVHGSQPALALASQGKAARSVRSVRSWLQGSSAAALTQSNPALALAAAAPARTRSSLAAFATLSTRSLHKIDPTLTAANADECMLPCMSESNDAASQSSS